VAGSVEVGGAGGTSGSELVPVAGVLGLVVDSVGGVDGSSVSGTPADGEADEVEAAGSGEVEVADGLGDGEVVIDRTFARSVAAIVGASPSGVSPAPAPPTSFSGPDVCSPTTAGGRTGATSTAPSLTPNHIAGPSPTATIAPKSAAGPRCMTDLPRYKAIILLFPGPALPISGNAKRTAPEAIVTQGDQLVAHSSWMRRSRLGHESPAHEVQARAMPV
jgi:hypothetical protein